MEKKLYRSKKDQKLCGVCAGLANYFGIDPTIVRLIWALAVFVGGFGVVGYIVCALVIPEEPENIIDME